MAIGAGAAQALSTVYLLRLARRRIRPDIPNFFRQMPVLRALLAALVTVVLELVVHPHVRTGPIGLLECVPAAAAGPGRVRVHRPRPPSYREHSQLVVAR